MIEQLIEEFEIHTSKTLDTLKILPADWNIAPTKEIYIIKANNTGVLRLFL